LPKITSPINFNPLEADDIVEIVNNVTEKALKMEPAQILLCEVNSELQIVSEKSISSNKAIAQEPPCEPLL
jgi:hypothetical protein